jgi:zinc transport system permease protein
MIEALRFDFIQHALAAGLLASIICGIMGTLAVVNRLVFLSGGIAHASYGGIGLALFFGWPYLVGTIGFSLAAAFLMAAVSIGAKHRADTIIGVIWALGMAIGIVLVDMTPGYNVDLMSYLFGSILTVPTADLYSMLAVGILTTLLVAYYYKDLLVLSYDDEFARIRGVPVKTLYFAMIGLLAVTIVLVIRVVGLILVIALLTIPPFIAEKYARSLLQMMAVSSILGAVFTTAGLWLSYTYDLTSGASIILVAGIAFLISLPVEKLGRFARVDNKPAANGKRASGTG